MNKPITKQQRACLVSYAQWAGRRWKASLLADWERSATLWRRGDWAYLHSLRTSHGPSWLASFRLNPGTTS
jgi:hypothetical protein